MHTQAQNRFNIIKNIIIAISLIYAYACVGAEQKRDNTKYIITTTQKFVAAKPNHIQQASRIIAIIK